MTESVVSFLVDRIGLFLEEEIKLLSGVRGEIEFVRDELERMTAFLRMADAVEESNPQVRVLVKQIREVAFDMEDILDEFEHHLARDQRNVFLSKLTSIKKMNLRHRIASQIQHIKSRIISISEGHLRYKDFLDHGSESSNTGRSTQNQRRGEVPLLEEDELVGIDNPRRQLLHWLVDEPEFKVISVVGMGGLGKSTLVKNVYESDAVRRHFKCKAWITVSKSFEVEQLLKDLTIQMFKEAMRPLPQGFDAMKSQALMEMLKLFFQEGRSLVVLDDIWDTEALDAIKYAFPRSENGNRLMLTTRISEVANAACGEFKGEVYCLEPLSFEMSLKLLCKKTFQGRKCPPHLAGIAKTILERCKGLPLAIVAISGVLARKRQENADEWNRVNRSLGNELQGNKLQSVSNILLLSYYDLPFYLQSCLLCMSMLPEDYEIDIHRLRGIWIAEGFVEQKDGMTKYEVAESYLMELQSRSLIQVTMRIGNARRDLCGVHDLLREVLLYKSREHNFATIVNENSTRSPDRIRRLSIHKTMGKVQDKKQILGLRSLLVFEASDFLVKSFGGNLSLLRVLDLEGVKNLVVFPKEITNLFHLRLLNLNCTSIREIPSSIGKLRSLEIFLLRETCVSSLPATILNLQRLSELAVSRIEYSVCGFVAVSGIGCLTNLTRLRYVEVSSQNGTIEELGRLKQLRILGIVNLKREDGAALCCSIEKLTNLHDLSLISAEAGEDEFIGLECLRRPPQFLRRIYLQGRLKKMPHWITSLHSLTILVLSVSHLTENVLEPIQALPNLESLEINEGFDGSELCFKAGGFQKLNELFIGNLRALRHIEVEMTAMPTLQKLTIAGCPSLEKVPLGIENLAKLKMIKISGVSHNLINRIDKAKGGEDYIRVQHIPEVHVFDAFRHGTWHSYTLSTN